MPGFDRTGPMGGGPMTGGARGYCNPGSRGTGYGNGRGLGLARGFRGGRGGGRSGGGFGDHGYGGRAGAGFAGYPATYPEPMNEVSALKADADALSRELAAINARIEELEQP